MIGTMASCPLRRTGCADSLILCMQVIGGILRWHPRVDEADQVGERVIAEDHVHFRAGIFVAINRVQAVREVGVQVARCPSREKNVPRLRPSTPSSVAIHFTPSLCAMPEHFFGDAALRRPHSLRTDCRKPFRADPVRAATARARLRDGDSDCAAGAARA